MKPTMSSVQEKVNVAPSQRLIRKVNRREKRVGKATFVIYIFFLIDFFLHLSQRIPAYGHIHPTVLEVLTLAGLLFIQRDRIQGRMQDPIFKAVLALYIYILLSLPFVSWPGSVIKDNLPLFVKATSFLFITALVVDSEKRLKVFLFVFVALQTYRYLEPLFMHITTGYWGDRTFVNGEFDGRLMGSPWDVVNANGLGFVIVTSIPFLHYFLSKETFLKRLLYFGILGAALYALVLTMSRGGFVALLVVAWMVFRQSKHKASFVIAGLVIAVVGWTHLSPLQKDRYLSLISSHTENSRTAEGRWHLIWHEFELGSKRPIFGHGLGTTGEAKFHAWGKYQASHNLYGELLIEIGGIGAFLFLRMLYRIFKRLRANAEILNELERTGKAGNLAFYQKLNMAMVAVFWMYVVYSLNYFGLSQYYWYLFGGLVLSSGQLLKRRMNAIEENGAVAS